MKLESGYNLGGGVYSILLNSQLSDIFIYLCKQFAYKTTRKATYSLLLYFWTTLSVRFWHGQISSRIVYI